jgi:aminoglycoside phosphotransferase (APT) family kinase protein
MTASITAPNVAGILASGPTVADVVQRAGTRAVLLGGSKDPNAKVTVVLLDEYGPAFVIKVATTEAATRVVRHEGQLLDALAAVGLGSLGPTVPRALGYLSADGLPALVTTAVAGVPMTVRYHAWRHTARRRKVRADFAAAAAWLNQLQTRTAGASAPVRLLAEAIDTISARFEGHPGLPLLRRRLGIGAELLAERSTPRTVVHGDYWTGNLLMDGDRVAGVVDWESGTLAGEPLRDVARFAVSYSLYLDRHTRPGRRVAGHRRLRADDWGAGIEYAVLGTGWYPALVRDYLTDALRRLDLPAELWREVLLMGIADVAATADHPAFARNHVDLLTRMLHRVPAPTETM